MSEVPDFIEPFEAWRAWRVIRRGGVYSLGSIVRGTVWPAREPLAAACLGNQLLPRLRRRGQHAAPAAECDCGIYGAPLGRIGQYVADAPCRGVARVLGRVALWGTVIECERGFRAAHAYPVQIYVPADAGDPWRISWEAVAIGLARYGVPVEPLAARASEATHHLEEKLAA